MTGQTIAQFEILEQIGQGGMGIVYKARDTKLNRIVALKVLPADKIADPARRSRFIQEARAASALNHPNIVTIYDIEQENGVDAIAMEFIKGRTLESLVGRKGLPLADILKHSLQIADALATAHAAGIVHRDLKPSNVMVTDAGLVKVLDFGLAKLNEVVGDDERATQSMRIGEAPRTEEGTLLGTVAYMSPEQAEGKKVDGRSDIFSFGAMLYEMVTGRRAFQGDSRLSILSAILREEPKAPSQLGEPVPRDLEKIIARCLRKDPTRRFQHMDDLKVALQELKEESESGALMMGAPAPVTKPARHWALAAALGVALAIAGAAGTAWWMSRSRKPASAPQLRRLTFDTGLTGMPAISPDGKLVAYASDRAGEGKLDIWLQQVVGGDAIRLTRLPGDEEHPSFSPDGSRLAFSHSGKELGIYVVSTLGGEPRKIADRGSSPRFSPDGSRILFPRLEGGRVGIYVLAANGGAPRRLAPDFAVASMPMWSPDGNYVLFIGSRDEKGPAVERADWWVTPLEGGAPIRTGVIETLRRQGVIREQAVVAPAAWVKGGVLFSAGTGDNRNLWQVALKPNTWQVDGQARQITFGAGRETSPSVAANGDLVFASVSTDTNFWSLPLDGNTGKVTGELRQITRNSASDSWAWVTANGRTIIFCSTRSGNSDVWKMDLGTGTETVVITGPGQDHLQGISSDGSRLVYMTIENRRRNMYVTTGGGSAQKVCEECFPILSADGSQVLYADAVREVRDMFLLDVASGRRTPALQASKDICMTCMIQARLSPDGRWGAFIRAAETPEGRGIILVPFREGRLDEKGAIPVEPRASAPYWSPDGNLLYFLSASDGYFCLWARRLNPSTKEPLGEAFAVHHFHSTNRFTRPHSVSVAHDKLVVALAEGSSNIWMTKIE